jgi:hypothetical protein
MSGYGAIERRIDRLAAQASRTADARLLGEMEDALAIGYAYALQGDARCRRLAQRLDALTESLGEDGVAAEVRRLRREQRDLEESTRALRSRLADLRHLMFELEGARPPD